MHARTARRRAIFDGPDAPRPRIHPRMTAAMAAATRDAATTAVPRAGPHPAGANVSEHAAPRLADTRPSSPAPPPSRRRICPHPAACHRPGVRRHHNASFVQEISASIRCTDRSPPGGGVCAAQRIRQTQSVWARNYAPGEARSSSWLITAVTLQLRAAARSRRPTPRARPRRSTAVRRRAAAGTCTLPTTLSRSPKAAFAG